MTGDGTGNGTPVVPRIDARRCRPGRPCNYAASHAIYMHDQFPKDSLIDGENLLALGHIVQFGDAVRSQVTIVQRMRVGRFDNGGGGELEMAIWSGCP